MSTPASTTVLLNRVKNTSAVSAANAVNVSNGAAAERIVAINVDGASAAAFACSSTCKLPVNSPNTTMVLHTHSLSGDGTRLATRFTARTYVAKITNAINVNTPQYVLQGEEALSRLAASTRCNASLWLPRRLLRPSLERLLLLAYAAPRM